MCVGTVPATGAEALGMLEAALEFLAAEDPAAMPAQAVADRLRVLERADAVQAAVRGRLLVAFDAQDAHLADGQRSTRAWLVHVTGVTRGQAGEYLAIQALARDHQVLLAGLLEGHVITTSVALQLARWTRAIPGEYRDEAEEILVAAARAGADLRSLAAICAEIRARTARPDPDDRRAPGPRAVPGHHPGRRRRRPRRPHPRMRRDGAGRPGRPVRPHGRRGPAHPPAAVPRCAGRGDAPPAGLGPAAPAGRAAGQGPGAHLLRRAPRAGPGLRAAGQVDQRVPGPVGRATGRPRRSAPGTAARGWRATRPAR